MAAARLVALRIRGDRREMDYETFFAASYPRLYRVAWAITGDGGDADDLVQDTLAVTLW